MDYSPFYMAEILCGLTFVITVLLMVRKITIDRSIMAAGVLIGYVVFTSLLLLFLVHLFSTPSDPRLHIGLAGMIIAVFLSTSTLLMATVTRLSD